MLTQQPYPCFTETQHHDTYEAINPSKPEHTQTGKTIIITGAGSGIGRETANAFAQAGAKRLVLIGRTESTLRETEALLPVRPETVSIFPCSVTDEAAIKKVAESVGTWDVLILNAGYVSRGKVTEAPLSEWWRPFEVHVKSVVIAAQAFIPSANSAAAIYAINTGCATISSSYSAGISAYVSSKSAQVRLVEYLALENPELFVCALHPGMVDTLMFRAAGGDAEQLSMDTPRLAAHFLVWLTQPKTRFLHGKFVSVNWDVEELCARADEIQSSALLMVDYEAGFQPLRKGYKL